MINIDPITFFKNFLYIKDADHSSPKLILITITITIYALWLSAGVSSHRGPLIHYRYINLQCTIPGLDISAGPVQGRMHADAKRCHGIGGPKFGIGWLRENFPGKH